MSKQADTFTCMYKCTYERVYIGKWDLWLQHLLKLH